MTQPDTQTSACTTSLLATQRVSLQAEGLVQGVGFRPFVARLATSLGLTGSVTNTNAGVTIELEGRPKKISECIKRLSQEGPPRSRLDSLRTEAMPPAGHTSFTIQASSHAVSGDATASCDATGIAPDVTSCRDCISEMFDPLNRRYRHPFTNCTSCGPRFSIQHASPYDRSNTSMEMFPMCADCAREYSDLSDRRFHAQANTCPDCGPKLFLWNRAGVSLAEGDDALQTAAQAIRQGSIVALKAVGGFQLIVDARNCQAVDQLRQRKGRPEKPFALMVPSLEYALQLCELDTTEQTSLSSPAAPIVIARRCTQPAGAVEKIAASVAPNNPWLGVMLPSSPLHHLLMQALGFPIVATSGNLAGEPIVIDEFEALSRLGDLADLFLVHDRSIVRGLDDSVVRVVGERPLTLRLGRGLAPLSIRVPISSPPILAFGGELKSAPAILVGNQLTLAAHIGDLGTALARQYFHQSIDSLCAFQHVTPLVAAHDCHPDYYSTQAVRKHAERSIPVQHHVAHLAACLADNELMEPALGVAWDGTGLGKDGSVWGGEFIVIDGTCAHRVAHLRQFPLPGGDAAIREPRRSALGLIYELNGASGLSNTSIPSVLSFASCERAIIAQMLDKNLNCPMTSSVGRLFDAVASLAGIRQRTSFEGQAAIDLESAIDSVQSKQLNSNAPDQVMPSLSDQADHPAILDWEDLIRTLISMAQSGASASSISATLHHWLVNAIIVVAQRVGYQRVLLTGGCFQNRYLSELAIERLRGAGFTPYWHRQIPPGDGGLAVGQAVWAAQTINKQESICA